jgi:LacI family transcriptional regulator
MGVDLSKPEALYKQLADGIRADIAAGKIKAGERIGSHHELAREYNVSLITVKRALSELIRDGVLFSRIGKGTYVNKPRTNSTLAQLKTIGLVLRDLKSPFFSMIVHSVEEQASKHGYNILVANSSEQLEKEESQIRHFCNVGVNGLIIASMTHKYTASRVLREIHAEGYPYIVVSYVKDPDIYFVGTDHEAGGYLAARHLIENGYRSIGYINGEAGNDVGELRKQGFLRALHENGLVLSDRFHFRLRKRGEWHDYNSGYEIGKEVAAMVDGPRAVFAYNDLAALGFQQALIDRGIDVPGRVAIIGFDGIERGEYAPVPLTTVQQLSGDIGLLAVANLLKRIDGQQVEPRMILSPRLVVRESCGAKPKIRSPLAQQES